MKNIQSLALTAFVLFSFVAFASWAFAADSMTLSGEGFNITVSAKAKSKTAGTLVIKLTSLKGFKVNKEFPHKLSLSAPQGIVLEKSEYMKDAATRLTDETLLFEIPYSVTAKPEKALVSTDFRFGICTVKDGKVGSCKFITESFCVQVPVK